jgi:lipopolysaccharide biosynthesis glycosyltransferase
MRTAYCFTPDRAFFAPAVRAIASLIDAEREIERDIFLVCEPDDVAPGFDRLEPRLRERIELLTVDFSRFDRRLTPRGRFSRAVFRRLFLDTVLPDRFARIVTIDSDMLIVRPGLAQLAEIDLRGRPLAAAMDMIFLMDFRGDWLARRFQAARRSLGLELAKPYFNAGLMAIDRARWRELKITECVVEALAADPERFAFMEQDALNATLQGNFAPLSPRFNFMGDFFLLDLERDIEPIVLHFVNSPKPWELAAWRGEARFAQNYRDWFERSPWPELCEAPGASSWRMTRPRPTPARRRFRQGLKDFLARQTFFDP